jgi:hypothetical protein
VNEPDQEPGTVRLYHGTTDEAAELICREGFRPLDKEALVESVAHAHALSKADLLRALEYTFLHSLGRSDEDFVSFKHMAFDVERENDGLIWPHFGGVATV